ncbi:MAG TPA: TIGR00266 family protein, partial [Bryobacteraceae bacterium]|nr:TIGR00266 family protein [Bryobacteraceae bacterium]
PFCTNCGNQVGDQSKFCPACGTPMGAAAAPVQSYTAAPTPLDYTIHGDNLQVARIRMTPGQEIYAEAGKMVYKHATVSWETRMTGETLGEKIWGAFKRKLSGESLFLTYFRTQTGGEVGFAGDYPGRIQNFDLKAGESIMVQRDSFLCAQSTVTLNIAFVKKIGGGLFGGEGFILEKLTGPGTVFIHGGGDFVEFTLGPGEVLQVDTGCVVGFEESVDYDVQFAGGIKTALFGGEGLFLTTLRGPGRVLVQSMTLEKLRRELSPGRSGGDERGPLESLGGFLRSED